MASCYIKGYVLGHCLTEWLLCNLYFQSERINHVVLTHVWKNSKEICWKQVPGFYNFRITDHWKLCKTLTLHLMQCILMIGEKPKCVVAWTKTYIRFSIFPQWCSSLWQGLDNQVASCSTYLCGSFPELDPARTSMLTKHVHSFSSIKQSGSPCNRGNLILQSIKKMHWKDWTHWKPVTSFISESFNIWKSLSLELTKNRTGGPRNSTPKPATVMPSHTPVCLPISTGETKCRQDNLFSKWNLICP